MTQHSSIAVVMPTHNLAGYVKHTIESVLRQTSLPDELIIIDDGSQDNTLNEIESAIKSAPSGIARILRLDHQGPGAARNQGVREARSEWIAFLDGDDLWLPEKLFHVRQAIADNSDAGIITHSDIEVMRDGRKKVRDLHSRIDPSAPLLPQLYFRPSFATSCMTVRRDAILRAGGFDNTLKASQDYDLWLKVSRDCRAVCIKNALTHYRQRSGSISTQLGLRYQCAITICFRHAPYLVPLIGSVKAYFFRWRFILIAHYVFFIKIRKVSDLIEFLIMTPRMGSELIRTLVSPVGRVGATPSSLQ